jgi:hypothetical protein
MDISKYKESVSILIPSYNSFKELLYLLTSIIKTDNSYFVKEIIIIDDNSTDYNYELINKYDNRINIIKNKLSSKDIYNYQTIGHLLKIGQLNAKGEFIVPCDIGTIFYPNKLFAQLSILDKNQDMLFCSTYHFNKDISFENSENTNEFKSTFDFYYNKQTDIPVEIIETKDIIKKSIIHIGSILYRRDIHKKVGYFHGLPSDESSYSWIFRCIQSGKCGNILQYLTFYNKKENNIGFDNDVYMINDKNYMESYINYIKEVIGYDKTIELVNYIGTLKTSDYIISPCSYNLYNKFIENNSAIFRMYSDIIYSIAKIYILPANYFYTNYKITEICTKLKNPLINLLTFMNAVATNSLPVVQIGSDLQTSTFISLLSHPNIRLHQYLEKGDKFVELSMFMSSFFKEKYFTTEINKCGLIHLTINSTELLKSQEIVANIRELIKNSGDMGCFIIDANDDDDLLYKYKLFENELKDFLPYPNVLPSEYYPQLVLVRHE